MSCGKRTYSISSGCSNRLNLNNNTNVPVNKKKKKFNRGTTFVPPTKFLLGGNIRDPLNLNGLQQEEEDGTTTTTRTRTSSTSHQEVKVCKDVVLAPLADFLLGGNINDPLNLKGIKQKETAAAAAAAAAAAVAECSAEQDKVALIGPSEDEKVGNDDPGGGAAVVVETTKAAVGVVPGVDGCCVEAIKSGCNDHCVNNGAKVPVNLNLNMNVAATMRRFERKDKIVSPVIPQPYRPLKAVPFRQIITPDLGSKASKTPKFKEKNTRFQYGNYQRYYGYRNAAYTGVDLRLEILERHRDFFAGKDVLDVGCNVGHISFIVARSFGPKSVTGVDIDRYLVEVAKKNVQYYVNCPSPYAWESPSPMDATPSTAAKRVDLKYKCYPVSMPILYGPIHDTNFANHTRKTFPKNVRFVQGNYVPESEAQLQAEQPQYDTIMCLSVTKWIHLNWGDNGLKMAFKRMFAQLKPGGILVLEPQSWDSYKRKKSLTETIWRNYRSIQLFPHHFDRYLLSSEVGFSRCQTLAVVNHQHKGFRRAIKVFKKPLASVHLLVSPNHVDSI